MTNQLINFQVSAAASTALAQAAALLSSGQCLKFGTISQAVIQAGGEGAPLTMYASSGVWDPTRGEVRFIGKRDSASFPYHFLVYSEAGDSWSSNRSLYSGGSDNQNGHGYDHNTVDPATGDHYFRPYNDTVIQKWTGSWSSLTTMGTSEIAGAITWFPGIGLIYCDRRRIRKFSGGTWTQIASFGNLSNAYHGVGEYNANSQIMIFGCGNTDDTMKKMTAAEAISDIATPPFNCGSAEGQGLLAAAPSDTGFVIWQKLAQNWAYYNPSADTWSTLTQSTGSGASPQTGTPNLDDSATGRPSINIPIDDYDVIMYVQSTGTTADVWLYKH